MTERPILFQGAMVRAILDGSKTQTRRIVKPAPPSNTVAMGRWQDPGSEPAFWAFLRDGPAEPEHPFGGAELHGEPFRCPYGQPDDRLWVRETFYAFGRWETRFSEKKGRDEWHFIDMTVECGHQYAYPADGHTTAPHRRTGGVSPTWWKRPAIHMPRPASRITLEITEVRVERLQDISRGDAMAEGCPFPNMAQGDDPRRWYAEIWEQINGPGSWAANPWVWVVEVGRWNEAIPCQPKS